jgi:hypothetical protein
MTTTETAVDCTTLAIAQVADILAGHAVFQEAVGLYSADEARERIFKSFYRPQEQTIEKALAVVFESAGTRWEVRADSTVLPKGELFLHLILMMENADDAEGEERRFNNFHGQLAQAISTYNGPGYRMLTTMTDPPARTHPKDEGAQKPRWDVGYTIAWSCL